MLAYCRKDGAVMTIGFTTPTAITEYDNAYDVQASSSGDRIRFQVRRSGGSSYAIDWAVTVQVARYRPA